MPIPVCPTKKDPSNLVLKIETDINAPIDIAFGVATDLELFKELESIVESVTITSEIKQGKGTKSHWVLVDPLTNRKFENDEEITHFEPPYQYAFKVLAGNNIYEGIHTFSENPDGTTHLHLCETFYYDADPQEYKEVVKDMVNNIKMVAEKRARST
jgi:uncharacterized membrane protein